MPEFIHAYSLYDSVTKCALCLKILKEKIGVSFCQAVHALLPLENNAQVQFQMVPVRAWGLLEFETCGIRTLECRDAKSYGRT